MKALGTWEDVTLLTASDFGRTLTSNGVGTDHAWGSNHLLVGGAVRGGRIHGSYPAVLGEEGEVNVGRGRLLPTTPWEGVWAPLAQWFGVEDAGLDAVLPNRAAFATAGHLFARDDVFRTA